MDKKRIKYPCIVEGKYDKIKLDSIIEGKIIVADGFGVFRDKEKRQMLIALSKITPIIVATDSDGAGLVIRNHLKSIIPKDRLYHVFIPEIKGKEKRKTAPSKEGTLGLEGMDAALIRELFKPYYEDGEQSAEKKDEIKSADLYFMGLSGSQGAVAKRAELSKALGLPTKLSTKAFLDAINMLYDRESIEKILEKM
jgi:ribonuclease M5